VLALAACSDDGAGNDASSASPSEESTQDATGSEQSSSATVTRPDTYGVGYRDVVFVDPTRPTAPNGDYVGASDRTLSVQVMYPARGEAGGDPVEGAPITTDGGPFPLVLFSHGFLATGPIYGALTTDIASAGYVVAAPTYPLSNTNAPGGPSFTDLDNQPADASFVIDELLADPDFAPILADDRIGAAGHSMGGMTTLGLGLASCCTDERLDAAAAYSGAALLGPNSFAGDVPLLLVHGDGDPVVPYRRSVEAFEGADAPKYLVTLLGGGHVEGFLGGDSEQAQVIVSSTVDFFDAYLKDDPAALDRLETDADVPGIATLQEET
jgi:dienelactone hydrolase